MPDLKDRNTTAGGRRLHPRVTGPFDGRWHTALTVPLQIYDLSVGGCLIHVLHEVNPGRHLTLDVHLPYEGWLTLEAEILYTRPEYGFAVKFVDVSEDALGRLERVISRLLTKAPHEE